MTAAATLLDDLRRQLRKLEDDLRQRCDDHLDLDQPFRDEWSAASTAGRTALTYPAWQSLIRILWRPTRFPLSASRRLPGGTRRSSSRLAA